MTIQEKKDILIIYRNYLFALQIREEYGDLYGDTDEIMNYYESILKDMPTLIKIRTR